MRLNKTQRIERDFHNELVISEYDVFRGLCAFFKLNLETIYFHLSLTCKLKTHYCSLNSFTIACVQRPQSLMNHEEVRKAILNMSSKLKEDVFTAMNDTMEYVEIQKKWMI